jgi:hypothetical protein
MCKADILGATLDWCSRFKVSSVGSRKWHYRESVNLLPTPARIEMRCALNVWIACSAWLRW